jgi:hypothetical protein
MIHMPMDVLHQFPVRKSKKQKKDFRDAVCSYVQSLGYAVTVESGSFGSRNVVMGDPETAKYLVTAHYDTCAVMPVPNFLTPCNLPVFILYQTVLWLAIILISSALGALSGVVLGEGAVSPISCLTLYGIIALMLAGPANRNNANDNTSGVVTLLEIMRTMPENQRHKACFVLFDLEECGLIGSTSYRKAHKAASDHQMVLNLDCVGDGDHLVMFPTKRLKKDRKKLTSLYRACGYFGKKSLIVHEKGFGIYPSDQMAFPYGVGICALQKNKFGLYLGKIHTSKDTVLEETNVNILRAALTSYICCDAAQ